MASSSSSPTLQEWLVICPDHEGALQKRLSVRAEHLKGLQGDKEDFWLWGGMSFIYSLHQISPFHHELEVTRFILFRFSKPLDVDI